MGRLTVSWAVENDEQTEGKTVAQKRANPTDAAVRSQEPERDISLTTYSSAENAPLKQSLLALHSRYDSVERAGEAVE